MKTVYKYNLKDLHEQTIVADLRWKPLSVTQVDNRIYLYALVDTDRDKYPHKVKIFGTGHPFEQGDLDNAFVGTVALLGGQLVFHVFVEPPNF
jgi:hypothetical protein